MTWNDKGHRLFAQRETFVGGHLCTAADLSGDIDRIVWCAEMKVECAKRSMIYDDSVAGCDALDEIAARGNVTQSLVT